MLRDIKDNISSPKYAFKHINDKIIKSISYLLILTLLLMLPLFIYLFTDRTKLTVSPEEIRSEVGLFLSDEIKIVDGKLLNEKNNKAFFVSGYYFNILYNFIYLEKCLKSLKKCSTSFKEFMVFFLQVLKFNFFFLGGEGFFSPLFSFSKLFLFSTDQ